MKIIILGAGQVGGTLAENLVDENNDITVVDTNPDRLRQLQDKFDLRVINGAGSHPRVLREAGAEDADMLVAVTNSDETNMIACQVAYTLFNTPNKIARIRSSEYVREADKLFLPEAIPIDHLIAPEQLVIDSIYKLIQYPGALQVVNFAEGRVSIVAVKAYYGGWSETPFPACASICRILKPGLWLSSARTDRFVRRVQPSSKPVMKYSLLPHPSISVQ